MIFKMIMVENTVWNAQNITPPMVNSDWLGGLCVYGVHILSAMAFIASHEKAAMTYPQQFSLGGPRHPKPSSMTLHVHWGHTAWPVNQTSLLIHCLSLMHFMQKVIPNAHQLLFCPLMPMLTLALLTLTQAQWNVVMMVFIAFVSLWAIWLRTEQSSIQKYFCPFGTDSGYASWRVWRTCHGLKWYIQVTSGNWLQNDNQW